MNTNTATSEMRIPKGFCIALLFALYVLTPQRAFPKPSSVTGEKITVFVSIVPQAYFVERVGGDRVDVSVMVGPGQSPATYEPMPRQMAALGIARLYFRIGVPFENVWMDRISKTNPHMKVIDTRRGITLLPMNTDGHQEMGKAEGGGIKDPHIWLSLRLVKVQSTNICEALIEEDPAHESFYRGNLQTFHHELDALDTTISQLFQHIEHRCFIVFHPSWGYFARDYGLEQMPIEIEGKEPSAKSLTHVIEQAKDKGIRVVFVQKQFSARIAKTVADVIGGKVVKVDPLAKDYLDNMKKIAEVFAEVLR